MFASGNDRTHSHPSSAAKDSGACSVPSRILTPCNTILGRSCWQTMRFHGVINSNMKPGNVGCLQVIFLGNPNSHFDSFGIFCQPVDGWHSVTLADEEWETATGGLCIRFNGEKNPRITEKNERFSWMLREVDLQEMANTYGRDSLYYYRMALGMWFPDGVESGVYKESNFLQGGAMTAPIWGYEPPTPCSFLDPSFTNGGDLAMAYYGKCGKDIHGKMILAFTEAAPVKVDPSNKNLPESFQMVRNWRRECEKRKIDPRHAGFDSTGGGITFAGIVAEQWSRLVLGLSFGGKASKEPVSPTEKELRMDRYVNKMTEIWYGAHPLLRTGQLRGMSLELVKELCSRHHGKSGQDDGRKIVVESKRLYKAREGKSPDLADSALGLIELCRQRLGLKPTDQFTEAAKPSGGSGLSVWEQIKRRTKRFGGPRRLSDK